MTAPSVQEYARMNDYARQRAAVLVHREIAQIEAAIKRRREREIKAREKRIQTPEDRAELQRLADYYADLYNDPPDLCRMRLEVVAAECSERK